MTLAALSGRVRTPGAAIASGLTVAADNPTSQSDPTGMLPTGPGTGGTTCTLANADTTACGGDGNPSSSSVTGTNEGNYNTGDNGNEGTAHGGSGPPKVPFLCLIDPAACTNTPLQLNEDTQEQPLNGLQAIGNLCPAAFLGLAFLCPSLATGDGSGDESGQAAGSGGLEALTELLSALNGDASAAQDLLSRLASDAADEVGPGRGAVYGTRVHTAFAQLIREMLPSDEFSSEVSYVKDRGVVAYGTPGSVRLDVVLGNPEEPTAVFDLKTGSATLTQARIAQILSQLPEGFQDIPVLEINP